MFSKRIVIFTGHFGSGKTEVAVNYALQAAGKGKKTAIIDLDIVNPFFRTADARNTLEAEGIKVITPIYANTNVDVPSLPAEISGMFEDRSYNVIIDVGGDDLGARAVSRYRDQIVREDYIHYFVVNTRRPMTRTKEEIVKMILEIQSSANLKVDKLVNNANILEPVLLNYWRWLHGYFRLSVLNCPYLSVLSAAWRRFCPGMREIKALKNFI